MYGFVATKKDYRMEKNPNSIAINIGELLCPFKNANSLVNP
jgi:hypothetical protein